MNVRDRFLTTLRGGRADRVPLHLKGFLRLTRTEAEEIENPYEREIALRAFGHCATFVMHDAQVNRYLVTPPRYIREVGREISGGAITVHSEIATPKGPLTAITRQDGTTNTTWTVKYPCESREDIAKICSVPWELPAGLAAPAPASLPPGLAERGVLRTGVSSPFVCVAGMMPYAMFLELCATDLPLLRELTEVCSARIMDVLDVVLANRLADYVWTGGCEWLTPPMGSPRLYEELVQPWEARIIERVHAAGAVSHVHCHGNVRSTLERVVARGADYFEPVEPPPDGDITMAEAKAAAAGRITLGGNVEARIIEHEDGDAVEMATRAAFDGGTHRMVLRATAEPIGPVTRRVRDNYHRMIDVWEELSPID